MLEDSFHVATLDHDAPAIFAGSLDFIRTHSRTGPARIETPTAPTASAAADGDDGPGASGT
jgi:hypothetical protein